MSDVWQWIKPSWMRVWITAASIPAFWIIWQLVDHQPGKMVLLVMALAWLFATFRLWFWSNGYRLGVR